jgi:pimeloyl-ACP methyl ester carboxylesterase
VHVDTPALLVLGERDNITGPAGSLGSVLRQSTIEVVPGRDHMTTVGDKVYKAAVLAFLGAP